MSNRSRPGQYQTLRAAAIVSLLVLSAPWVGVRADDPPAPEIFRDNRDEVLQGAAALAGAGNSGAATVLGLLIQGDQQHLWKLEQTDKAPELRPAILARVKDSTGMVADDSAFDVEAYCEAAFKSSLTSLGAFANSTHADVTFAHLFNEPWKYRGQVIHFEGKLRRIRSFDAPGMLEAKGIKTLYECWLFDTNYGVNPVCLVCTELPDGLKPAEQLDLMASFDAYFFKRYRYKAAESKAGQAREAPLFIGRSFVLTRAPVVRADDERFTASWQALLMCFLGVVLVTFVLAFGLHLWFRRGDRRVRARIEAVRGRDFVDPGAAGLPGSTPSAN
jgi:hypothetical protein